MKRDLTVDLLRGSSMLAIILIHTSYFYIGDQKIWYLWNYAQFAVPVFIFCSSYLFFQKDYLQRGFYIYLKKRLQRLLIPYYVFLLFFLPLVFLLNPQTKINYVLQSIFLTGGADINWLVLLFLYLTPLFFVLKILFMQNKIIFYSLFLVSFLSTGFFLFISVLNYKPIMWLPYLLPVFFSLFLVYSKDKNRFLGISFILSGVFFVFTYFLQKLMNHPLSFIQNKYPPNLYFLSFGIMVLVVLFWLFQKIQLPQSLNRFLTFLSVNSYSIFFIHYFILTSLLGIRGVKFSWLSLFALVLFLSLSIQFFWNRLPGLLKSKK